MRDLAYVLPGLTRNPRRTGAYLVGTIIAVGLLSAVLFFVVGASQVLTQRSIANVLPDMQVVLNEPTPSVPGLQRLIAREPGVASAQRFALASFSMSSMKAGNRLTETGTGKIVALDPSYLAVFGAPAIRRGSLAQRGVVISQDLGTNLGARVGDRITLRFPGGVPPQSVRVTGVASMLNTDLLFAPLDPLLRLNPFNPPANVVIMRYSSFERTLKPLLLRRDQTTSSGSTLVHPRASVVEEMHVRLNRGLIPADPSQAKLYTARLGHRLGLALTGRVTVLDNVGSALDQAQSDVLWAQIIFVFLALPGVILAAALSRYVSATVLDSQRRELALLRVRGIGPRQLAILLASTLLAVSLSGVVIGLFVGWFTTRIVSQYGSLQMGPLLIRTILLGLVAGLVLGGAGTFWPLLGFIRAPVVEGRRRVGRNETPFWSRFYLDVLALLVGIGVYLVTQRNGFQPALNAEGNPTLTLSLFTFLAPLLFWVGGILLLVRVSRVLVVRSGGTVARIAFSGREATRLVASRTLSRRSGPLFQAVLLVAMAVAFSSGLAIFLHTYQRQQQVDAELTLGSDVKVSVIDYGQSGQVASRLHIDGVTAVTPFRSTVAYVGTEIQDIFGIDVSSFNRASRLSDSFFVGSTAGTTLHRLQATRNGIIVSAETARDYSLNLGDTIRLRMFDHARGRDVPITFRLVGVAREFATAPKDAFLVANLAYIESATHDRGVDTYLVKTSGQPSSVANALRRRFSTGPAIHIQSLSDVQQRLSTSLTSLDLSALSRIDYIYTLILVLAALMVFVIAVLLDRGREFALMEALGVTQSQIRALLFFEVACAAGIGSLLGLAIGAGFAQMLMRLLTSIFDPPPDALAIPWSSLVLTLGLVYLSGLLAWCVGSVRLAHSNLASDLREG